MLILISCVCLLASTASGQYNQIPGAPQTQSAAVPPQGPITATNYNTGDGQIRSESVDSSGNVKGQYSYVDPSGKTITVKYSAGKDGFQVEGDHLPKAPSVAPVAPVAPQAPYNSAPQYNNAAPAQSLFTPASTLQGNSFTPLSIPQNLQPAARNFHQQGFPQSGFQQQPSFPQQNGGFQQQAGFPQQNGGFQQQAGFPQQNGGFQQQPSFPQNGFQQQPSFSQNGGFQQQPSFSQNGGFPQAGFPQQNTQSGFQQGFPQSNPQQRFGAGTVSVNHQPGQGYSYQFNLA